MPNAARKNSERKRSSDSASAASACFRNWMSRDTLRTRGGRPAASASGVARVSSQR